MPNFGDFNFNDDTPGPDTDPTPNVKKVYKLGEAPFNEDSNTDGIQNDVTNFPEPGEGDSFNGGYVSIWDNQSNPEEPGAQQDHIPPVVQKIDEGYPLAASFIDFSFHGSLNQKLADIRQQEINDKKEAARLRRNELAKQRRDARKAFRFGEYDPSDEELSDNDDAWNGLFAKLEANEPIEDYISRMEDDIPEPETSPGSLSQKLDELDPSSPNYLAGTLSSSPVDLQATSDSNAAWDSIYESAVEEESPSGTLYDLIQGLPDRNRKAAGIHLFESGEWDTWFESITDDNMLMDWLTDDEIDIILDTDDAESSNNPTGIGEMFDEVTIAGFDATTFSVGFNDDDLEGMEALESADFLNLVEAALGTDDINDYMTDLVNGSNLIEFQDMGDSALENFDGLL